MSAPVKSFDAIIVGGGPAALTAAIYLERFRRDVLVIDGRQSRARNIPKIRNLPGRPAGVSGEKLLRQLRQQVAQLNGQIVRGTGRVQRSKQEFFVRVGYRRFRTKTVILATGVKDIEPELGNHAQLCRRNLIAYCPICDGFEYCDEDIAVLCSAEQSLSAAKSLGRYGRSLTLVLAEKQKLSPRMRARVHALGAEIWTGDLSSLCADGRKRVRITLHDQPPRAFRICYVLLGTRIVDTAFRGIKTLRRTKAGFIRTSDHFETNVPNLYAIGDCVSGLSQISVAAGQAAIAATAIHNRLLSLEEQSLKS